MQVTLKEAKNRFGYVCAQAKAASQPKTLAERRKAINQTHKAWIDEQNARFEKNGLWCDDLRVW